MGLGSVACIRYGLPSSCQRKMVVTVVEAGIAGELRVKGHMMRFDAELTGRQHRREAAVFVACPG